MTARRRLLGVLWAAGAVSVACNILAANPGPVARAVGAWFPVALLLVVHVFGEVRLPPGWPRRAAVSGAVVVAVAAAVASFNHMHEIALAAGEPPLVAVLFPLSVDGLAVVASVALAALDRHELPTERTATPASGRVELNKPATPVAVTDLPPNREPVRARSGVGPVFPPVLNGAGSTNSA